MVDDKSYEVLRGLNSLPIDSEGMVTTERLLHWIEELQKELTTKGYVKAGKIVTGELLANGFSKNENEITVETSVCDIIEILDDSEIERHFEIAIRNKRGVVSGRGGEKDRVYAKQFEKFANSLGIQYIRMNKILKSIADSYNAEAKHNDDREKLWDLS